MPTIQHAIQVISSPTTGYSCAITFQDIIDQDILDSPPSEMHQSIRRLRNLLKSRLALAAVSLESELVVELVKKIFIPLFEEVELESTYSGSVNDIDGATATHLGMGTAKTWHGETELRC